MNPIALDVTSNAEIFLVAVVATVAGRKEYGIPDRSNHVAFKYEGGKWRHVPVTSVPREVQVNMLGNSWGLFIRDGSTVDYVGLDLKRQVDSDLRLVKRYKDWPRQ